MKHEIDKRLDIHNIDRVALAYSSNKCENFFSVLVKYTSGKRIYLGKKGAWSTRIKFVAALKSNPRISDEIRMKAGITTSSASREKRITQQLDRNSYKACYK